MPGTGPAAGPPTLDHLAADVARADEANAEGRPAQARRLLVPVLRALDGLGPLAGTAPLRCRALVELAKSDFETRGDARTALALLDELLERGRSAPATAWPGLVPAVAGVRGLLALRAGRQDEALRWLDRAVAAVDDADPLDACRALLNRGVLHGERHELAQARGDWSECARRARQAGFARLVFKAEHNLGYLEFLAGRLPDALARMEAAARSLPGPPRPIALLDRAHVLLEAGLVAVADATLAQAAELFAAQRLSRDVAECELGRAECAILRGDAAAARVFAVRAGRRFRRRGDEAWVVRSALLGLQADAVALAAAPTADDAGARARWAALARRARRQEELCRDTGRAVWSTAASYLRIEADLARGAVADPTRTLAELGPVRPDDPVAVRLHGRRVRAMLALAAGDRSRAGRHVRAGQRDLGVHRSRFGSLDLRTAGAVHGTALGDLDVRIALDGGRPAAVLEAAERVRTAIGGTPRVNPPSDPETAALLWELRQVIETHRGVAARAGSDPERVRVVREVQRLKHEILARSWHERGRPGDDHVHHAEDVRRALGARPGAALLDVLEHRGELLAVEVASGGLRLHRLGESAQVVELVRRVHADLEVTANPLVPAELRAAAERSQRRGLAVLGERLAPLLDAPDELVVVAGGWLGVLPWSMLPGRLGRPTVVAPSVHHWATRTGTGSAEPARVTAVAGPGLRHADTEVREVARLWPGAEALVGPAATVARTVELLGSPGLVHLAAHGRHEPGNPLFSSVRMADGPLFAHELDTGTGAPELVLLSSCEVGRASLRAGGEALGLASVLLRRGVGCVVAAVAPLPDETALRVMTRAHTLLRGGEPVARAVATATAEEADRDGRVPPLTCLGAPL